MRRNSTTNAMTVSRISRREAISGTGLFLAACTLAPARASSSATALITHPAFALHNPGPLIVERPARMKAIDEALASAEFASLVRQEAPLRDDVEPAILAAHSRDYYERVRSRATDSARL